jgi:hypothetical protein
MSVGLKSDQRGRLFVAGGGAGDGRVVSTRTGKISPPSTPATPGTEYWVTRIRRY